MFIDRFGELVFGKTVKTSPEFIDKVVDHMCGFFMYEMQKEHHVHKLTKYTRVDEKRFCATLYCPETRQGYGVCGHIDTEIHCPGCNKKIIVREKIVAWLEVPDSADT